MNEDKKCPLLMEYGKTFGDCEKELCAWWSDKTQMCAIVTIAERLRKS